MDVVSLVHLFYNNPTFSDLTMMINSEPIHLHKIVLVQSQKFATVLESQSSTHHTIILENYEFAQEMKMFLSSFYTGEIDLRNVNVQFLLMLSVEYGTFWVEKRCAEKMGENVNRENVLDYLETACKVGSHTLEEICVQLIEVHVDNLEQYYELAINLISPQLKSACAKVLRHYRVLWKFYKSKLWKTAGFSFVKEVFEIDDSIFAPPTQTMALIEWISVMSPSSASSEGLLSRIKLKYLPFRYVTCFLAPGLYDLNHTLLSDYLPDARVSSFVYFVTVHTPSEHSTEKCRGVKTMFYTQDVSEIEYREYHITLHKSYFTDPELSSTCSCTSSADTVSCECYVITCHALSAGVMLTINPRLDTPLTMDSGRSPTYWYIRNTRGNKDDVSWSELCGVTYGCCAMEITRDTLIDLSTSCDTSCDTFNLYFFL